MVVRSGLDSGGAGGDRDAGEIMIAGLREPDAPSRDTGGSSDGADGDPEPVVPVEERFIDPGTVEDRVADVTGEDPDSGPDPDAVDVPAGSGVWVGELSFSETSEEVRVEGVAVNRSSDPERFRRRLYRGSTLVKEATDVLSPGERVDWQLTRLKQNVPAGRHTWYVAGDGFDGRVEVGTAGEPADDGRTTEGLETTESGGTPDFSVDVAGLGDAAADAAGAVAGTSLGGLSATGPGDTGGGGGGETPRTSPDSTETTSSDSTSDDGSAGAALLVGGAALAAIAIAGGS